MYKIYCYTNIFNGHKYIGMTKQTLAQRAKRGEGYLSCPLFYAEIKEFGWEAFVGDILAYAETEEEAQEKETKFIIEIQPSLNVEIEHHLKWSQATKDKISISTQGLKNSRAKIVFHNGINTGCTIRDYAKKLNMSESTLKSWCRERRNGFYYLPVKSITTPSKPKINIDQGFIPLKSLDNQFGINEKSEVVNFNTGHILTPHIGIDGYQHLILKQNKICYRKRVHRLMAEAFLGNCKYVDHIDNDKSNNLLSNLRSITNSENIKKGWQNNRLKNNAPIIAKNKETEEIKRFCSIREAERTLNIDRHRISSFLKDLRPNHTNYEFYIDE